MAYRPDKVTTRIAASFLVSLLIIAALFCGIRLASDPQLGPNGQPMSFGQVLILMMLGYGLIGSALWVASFLVLTFVTPSLVSRIVARFADPSLDTKPDLIPELPEALDLVPARDANPWAVLGLSLAFAALGFVVTPFAVCVLGVLLLSGMPGYSSQGEGFGLFLAGLASTLPGAAFWGMVGSGRAVQDPKAGVGVSWISALSMYAAGALAVIVVVRLSFR